MSTLYELTGQYLALLELAEDPDTDPIVLIETMEALDGEIEVKADNYARIIRIMEAGVMAMKTEEARIANRRRAYENNIQSMKNRLEDAMFQTGKTKFKTDLFSFNIQKNPPKVVIDNPSRIYDAFLIPQEPKIDTAAIKAALKNEDEAPLWDGIAHLEQGESLRIR